MFLNTIKNKFKRKQKIFSYWITNFNLNNLEIVLKLNVYDSFVVDLEHSSICLNEVEKIIMLVDAYKLPTYIRVEKIDIKTIGKLLDLGAYGIIAPNINSDKDIRLLKEAIFYPPLGNRGVGLSRSTNHGLEFHEYYKNFNKLVSIIPMIENVNAIKNLENILHYNKLIDCIMIGPYDLSASLGDAGNFSSKKFKDCEKKILYLAKKYKLSCGIHIVHTNKIDLKKFIKKGYNYFPFSTDTQIFIDGLHDKVKILKKY